ncbi:MAG: archaeosortase/exosortase family protein [Ferruginibacter sp.]|nr:archaeosortase/exosortase family protein [Ferruginibacter sp.]
MYLLKFAAAFCICYFGTLAIIGLSVPGGYYSGFVDKYLNFIPLLRDSLLNASKYFLSVFGYESYQSGPTQLRMVNGGAVNLVYSCLGYGVTAFWLAFVFANNGGWKKKLAWMLGGTILLYIINVVRISLVLLSNTQGWKFPFGWDNHTWFNIVAYAAIFCMIYLFDRTLKLHSQKKQRHAGQA